MNDATPIGATRGSGRLEAALRAGWFAVTSETGPPDSASNTR